MAESGTHGRGRNGVFFSSHETRVDFCRSSSGSEVMKVKLRTGQRVLWAPSVPESTLMFKTGAFVYRFPVGLLCDGASATSAPAHPHFPCH